MGTVKDEIEVYDPVNTNKNVYKYKGNTDISDIVFFEKN